MRKIHFRLTIFLGMSMLLSTALAQLIEQNSASLLRSLSTPDQRSYINPERASVTRPSMDGALAGTIQIIPCQTATALSDTLICAGETVTLTAPSITYCSWEYFEDFESPVGIEWSDTIRFPFNNSSISGPYSKQSVSLQMNNLPPHDSIQLEFKLYIHDSWDGNTNPQDSDFYFLAMDNDTLLHTTFCNHYLQPGFQSFPGSYPAYNLPTTGAAALLDNICSVSDTLSALYSLEFKNAHSAAQTTIRFMGSPDQNLCDESWSIDNVKVKLLNVTTGPLHYLWSTNDTTPTLTVTPSQTTTYTVIVTNNIDTLFDTCTVFVAATDAGPGDSICLGDSALLQAVPGALVYLWTPASGLSNTSTPNPSASPAQTTLYHLAAQFTKNNLTKTCTDSVMITVVLPPQISLGPDITQCQGPGITLNPGGGFSSYQWSNSATTPTVTVTQSGQYWVNVKNSFNCENNDTINVTIIPYPVVSVAPSIDSLCIGDTLVIKATSGIANVTYAWSNGSLSDSAVVWPTNPTTYYVTVTNQGCSRVDSSRVITKHVPDPYCYASKYTLCDGDSTTVQVISLYSGTSYQWSSGQTTSTLHVSPSVSTTYVVTATYNGCSGDTSITIEVNPIPQIQITASPISVCIGDSTKLTATSDVWGTLFSWSTGKTGAQVHFTPSAPTQVMVTGTVNGCQSSDSILITIKPVPDLQLLISTNPICQGDSAIMTASSTLPGTSFLWTTGAVTPQIIVSPYIATIYIVIATLNGCFTDSTFVLEVNPRPQLQVTPSPVGLCIGDSAVINVTSDLPGTTFSWSNGMTGTPISITPSTSTTLVVTGTVGGCSTSQAISVDVTQYPVVSLGPDGFVCEGDPVTLTPSGSYTTLEWWDGSSAMQHAVYLPGIYWVKALNGSCATVDSAFYDECPSLVVPNVFTPNADGFNDKFYPVHTTVDLKSIHIYSRWGSLVFFSEDQNPQWDGTHNGQPCTEGVYYYMIRYFNPKFNLVQEKAGAVQLLR